MHERDSRSGALVRLSGRCDLVVLEGGRHGFPFEGRYFPRTLQAMDAFLESIGDL